MNGNPLRALILIFLFLVINSVTLAQVQTDTSGFELETTKLKSKKTAIRISLISTFVGTAIVPTAGLMVGPVSGSLYARDYKAALNGSLNPILIGVGMAGAILLATPLIPDSAFDGYIDVVITAGGLLILANAIHQIFHVGPKSVDKYNYNLKDRMRSLHTGPALVVLNGKVSPGIQFTVGM